METNTNNQELEQLESEAQQRFNEVYITATEICERLNVSRPAILMARRRNQLPNPIDVCQQRIFVWERATIEPYLASWEKLLTKRRETYQ